MMVIYITIIAFLFNKIICIAQSLDWSNHLYSSLENINPYQIVIYKNQTENNNMTQIDLILTKLPILIPVTLWDLSKEILENSTLNSLQMKKRDAGKLLIYLQCESDRNYTKIMDFIDFYEEQYPKQTRPKCLFIYLNEETLPENFHSNILQRAWKKKFLDFTILQRFIDNEKAFIYTLNPFFNKIHREKFSKDTVLFPNKLYNLNKYPLLLPIYSHEPHVSAVKDSAGKQQMKSFNFDSFLLTVLREMNFFVKFVELDSRDKNPIQIYANIINSLKNCDINMGLIPIITTRIDKSLPSIELNTDGFSFLFVMKYQQAFDFDISLNILFGFASLAAFILIIKWIFHFLRWTTFSFDILDVVRIAVGMALTSLPKILSKRITIVIAMFASMILSAEFFTFLTKIFHTNEVSFNSIHEIYQSEFKLVVDSTLYKAITNYLDTDSKELFDRHVVVNDSVKCPNYALENEKMICIMLDFILMRMLKNPNDITKVMKVLPFRFLSMNVAYPFEPASPYLSRFELIFLRMYQSGIFYWLNDEQILQKQSNIFKTKENEELKELLLMTLTLLIVLGAAISVVVFISEIIISHVTSK